MDDDCPRCSVSYQENGWAVYDHLAKKRLGTFWTLVAAVEASIAAIEKHRRERASDGQEK